ncbi:MAG: hypothetical protein RIT04_327 [Candidatus Parcubacteria bacterium]|jgi:hypothetical protein
MKTTLPIHTGCRHDTPNTPRNLDPYFTPTTEFDSVVGAGEAAACKVYDPIIDVRLYKAAQPIMTALGMIRVFPVEYPQRTIDLFEGTYGLNGRTVVPLTTAAAKDHLNEIWLMLRIVHSPLTGPSDLKQRQKDIASLEKLRGKSFNLGPILPLPEHARRIEERIKADFDRSKLTVRIVEETEPIPDPNEAQTLKETLVYAACKAAGITLREFYSADTNATLSRTRNIVVYLLEKDVRARLFEILSVTRFTKKQIAHGQRHIAQLLEENDVAAIEGVAEVRWLYRQAVNPTPELPFPIPHIK